MATRRLEEATGRADAARRASLAALFVGQALSTGATTVSTSLSSILAARLTGDEALSGVPATLNFFASALAAYLAGRLMAARGRRLGLSLGYATGSVGAALAALAALSGSFPGFLAGSSLVGLANGAISQGRYAAAELVPPAARGRTLGLLLSGSVLGALLSAALSPLVAGFARSRNLPEIELGWLLGAALLALGGAVVAAFLRPAPANAPLETRAASEPMPVGRTLPELLRARPVRAAVVSLTGAQAAMVMLMVLMPLHARHLGHGLPTISGLLTAHFAGMFGLAWLTGRLADAWGRPLTIGLGGLLLAAAAGLALPATTAAPMGVSLFLLGLGWNLCYVAGSAMLADNLRPEERARAQGSTELLVWLAAAGGSLGGGALAGWVGFPAVAAAGLALSALPLLAALAGNGRLAQPARP